MFSQPTNPFGYLAGVFDPKLRQITGCPPPKLGGKMMTGAEDEVAAFTRELKKAGRRQRLMVTLDVHRALSVAAVVFEDPLAWAAALLAFTRTMTWAEVNLPSTPLPEEMLKPKPEGGRWCCAPAEFARHAYALEAKPEHELRPRLCVPGTELEKSIGRLFHDHVFGEGAPWLWLRKATDPQPDWTAIFEQRKLLIGGKATWAELVALTLQAGRPKPSAAVVGIACFQVALTTGHDVRNLLTAELAAEVATLRRRKLPNTWLTPAKFLPPLLFLPPKLLERLSAKQAEIIEPEIKI